VVGGDWYGRPANSGRHLRQFRVQRLSGNWGRIWTRCRSVRRTREWTVQEMTLRIIPRDAASESWLQEQLPKQLTKRLVRRQCSQSLESGCYEKETISIYHRTLRQTYKHNTHIRRPRERSTATWAFGTRLAASSIASYQYRLRSWVGQSQSARPLDTHVKCQLGGGRGEPGGKAAARRRSRSGCRR